MTPTTYVLPTTRAQRLALLRLFQRDFPHWHTPRCRIDPHTGRHHAVPSAQWRRFRRSFRHYIGGYIGAPWHGMFIGIERDGYTHT